MLLIAISNLNKEANGGRDAIDSGKDSTRWMKLKTINRCIMNFKLTNHS